MNNLPTEVFDKGIHNLVNPENIPQSASKDSLGWISNDDSIELCRGREIIGSEDDSPDQINIVRDSLLAIGQDDTAGNNSKIAQSFTPTRVLVSGVSLYKEADTGTFAGTVTISIQEDSSNSPSGTDLISKTITNADWLEISTGHFDTLFASEYSLTVGNKYWIVISTSTNDSSNCINISQDSNASYEDHLVKTNNTTEGWSTEPTSLYFKTITAPYVGVNGFHITYKADGTEVMFKKNGTSVQWYNGTTWVDIITGLTSGRQISFSDYVSLAGNFTYVGGKDGLWKIVVANPTSVVDVYDEAKNFKGLIRVDRGRMFLWGREKDKTGLYGSKIDPQTGGYYTTESSENIGSSGSQDYTGTLDFKSGGSKRTCFAFEITATVDGETETFTDDLNGLLTSDKGGTGTINYATGEFTLSFSGTTSSTVSADYQWEDSNVGGITDFTASATRVAGEGFIFRQDVGGDVIQKVSIQDGKYYSIKERSVYEVSIDADDSGATNLPYRLNIGMPSYGASTETQFGIIFMNTANPDKPHLTTLQRTTNGTGLEPITLAPQFDFSKYSWDQCHMETYGEYVIISGRTKTSPTNNRLFLFNTRLNIISVLPYFFNDMFKSNGFIYGGSSVNGSISKFLVDFDDEDAVIDNYWEGRDELFGASQLKKVKWIVIKGKISKEQVVEVYIDYDNDGYQLIGTIRGSNDYVDTNNTEAIGVEGVGISAVGGESDIEASNFIAKFKLKRTPKFRKRTIKLVATNIGWISVNKIIDQDVRLFEDKLPKKYRLKEDVSTDGLLTDQ